MATQHVLLRVNNVGKFAKERNVKQLLEKHGVKFKDFKKHIKKPFGLLSFACNEDCEAAKPLVVQLTNKKGQNFTVEPYVKVNKWDRLDNDVNAKKKTAAASARDATSPLSGMPYEEQLKLKQKGMCKVLQRYVKDLVKAEQRTESRKTSQWLQAVLQKKSLVEKSCALERQAKRQRVDGGDDDGNNAPSASVSAAAGSGQVHDDDHDKKRVPREYVGDLAGAACPLKSILPAPQTQGYRNKCEFTIARDASGKVCVGFRLGGYSQRSFNVDAPHDCPIVPRAMLEWVDAFQASLSSSSFPPYSDETKEGFWRVVMLRYFKSTDSLMAMITVKLGSVTKQDAEEELKRVSSELMEKSFDGAKLCSTSCRFYEGISAADPNDPTLLIQGQSHIIDELDGIRFSVSDRAFFQVNSLAAQVLFRQVRKWALETSSTCGRETTGGKKVLLDLCCGTGTIGLSMAKHFTHVIGVDSNESAIMDARANAGANGIKNASFIAAMAEDVIDGFMNKYKSEKEVEALDPKVQDARKWLRDPDCIVTAVVDPPRAGLHRRIVRELRMADNIKRLVYVSCNPTGSFVENAVALSRVEHKQRPGKPFRPVKAIPVDLFPHTEHCELVVLFDKVFE